MKYSQKQLQKWYDEKNPIYQKLEKNIEILITNILSAKNIQTHNITSRTKSFDSFQKKMRKKDKNYTLGEVTDLTGIRIIAYVLSDVDKIVQILQKEFIIDNKNSKRGKLDGTNSDSR